MPAAIGMSMPGAIGSDRDDRFQRGGGTRFAAAQATNPP